MTGRRAGHRFGVILIVLAGTLVGCQDPPGTLIALATFDNDTTDALPDTALPGEPAGDILTVTGDRVRVRSSPPFSTKFLEISRGNLNSSVKLVPSTTNAGRYKMALTGAVSENQASVRIRFIAGSAGELQLSFLSSGKVAVRNGNTTVEVGSYQIGSPHAIRVDLQATLGRAIVDVQSAAGETHTQYIPLSPSSESGPGIELWYPATLLEAFPGTYGVDQMSIRKI